MEQAHSEPEPVGYSDSPFTISQPPDIKNWFSSYVYESLALSSVREEEEEDKYILGADIRSPEKVVVSDNDRKPMNKSIQETYLYESSSFPSEPPPDIGNWFSSYTYESPPILDTNDALYFSVGGEDSECVKETQAEEEEEEEEEETKEIDAKDVCPSLFEQQLVSSAKVTDFSQSQHLLSEPPDVGNWFSSYEYQSPHLSDTHGFEFCSSEKDELIVEESDTEGENSSGFFRKTKSKQETIIAPGWLKSNDCIAAVTKDEEVSADDEYSNQEREKKSPVILFNASTKKVDKDLRFKEEALFSETKEEPNFSRRGYNPKPQSFSKHEAYLQELRPKHIQETISNRQMSPRKAAQKACPDGKENVDTETGFVSLKKARFRESRDQSSMTRLVRRVLGECSRSKELNKIVREEDEEERNKKKKKKKRRVLGETWNHQLSGGEEIAGKWSCPQKKKGKSGPPLKQLRLDAWVHKV